MAAAIPYFGSGNSQREFYSDLPALGTDIPAFALDSGVSEPEKQTSSDESEPFVPQEESIESQKPTPNEGDLAVFADNLCWYDLEENATLDIINRTSYDVNLKDYLKKSFRIQSPNDDEPLVLIVQTHGSESYLENGHDFYSPKETFRSTDVTKNVVHIGEILAETLNSKGIKTIHDKTMYDQQDFNKSYGYSRSGILKALEEYPSIKFVIDIHRDSIFDSSGRNIKPLTQIQGKYCAQLMLVIGTDQGGISHPNWKGNLTFATKLQDKMNQTYPTLARPINLRTSAFNQQLTPGSILLEAGSCGNTLEEAENAIVLFGEVYAEIVKESIGS